MLASLFINLSRLIVCCLSSSQVEIMVSEAIFAGEGFSFPYGCEQRWAKIEYRKRCRNTVEVKTIANGEISDIMTKTQNSDAGIFASSTLEKLA